MDPARGEANLLAAALARDVGWCAKHQIESTPSDASPTLTFEEEEENFPPLVCHPFLNFPSLSSLPLAHFLTFPVICKGGGRSAQRPLSRSYGAQHQTSLRFT